MDTLQAIPIDLADYEWAGEGANGITYNHRSNPDILLKLYSAGKIQQPLDELTIARKVYEAGIKTPLPGDYVTDGERFGVRFQRIRDKQSIARLVGNNPEQAEYYAEIFAGMCKELHATHLDTKVFECAKDRLSNLVVASRFYTVPEKDRLLRFIADSPDADTAVHGDLQFGNVIIAGGERYFIDLGDFCYGHPLFDLGMVYGTAYLSDPDFIREAFHMEQETSIRFWKAFASFYFGTDRPLADIEKEVRPYGGLKSLMVERDAGFQVPGFYNALKPIINP